MKSTIFQPSPFNNRSFPVLLQMRGWNGRKVARGGRTWRTPRGFARLLDEDIKPLPDEVSPFSSLLFSIRPRGLRSAVIATRKCSLFNIFHPGRDNYAFLANESSRT